MSRFYVTTPIYYINDTPHLGTAYTTIAADVLARFHRLRGDATRFLTGTDEHGLKIQRAADERKMTPIDFADELSQKFREAWPPLACAPDDFIRTTEERHVKKVQELWLRIREKNPGDIYLGHYEGLYCVPCEAYYTEKDLLEGKLCPVHKKAVEPVKEESYFFKLSKYGPKLLDIWARRPELVRPESRRNEVISFVKGGLEDLSVSRTTFDWGIKVPGDERHVMYVWFDALANYWTALQTSEELKKFWPAQHILGKDIIRFHCIYWPAFLLAAGFGEDELPKCFAHGWLTYGGHKMSKTLRNTVNPGELAKSVSETVGADTVRYCLMRSVSFGQDGDFSIDDVLARYQADLGNTLGNLLNRVLPFADVVPKQGAIGEQERAVLDAVAKAAEASKKAFEDLDPTTALAEIWAALRKANEYVDQAAPWALKKSGDQARLDTVVATLVEVLESAAVMIAPVLPNAADAIRAQLGMEPIAPKLGVDQWPTKTPANDAGRRLVKGAPIFPRLEKEKEAEIRKRYAPPAEPTEAKAEEKKSEPLKATIPYDDFGKIDLRVGLVRACKKVPKKDKLLDLEIDLGEERPRRIISGLALSYAPEELVGKKVVVLANLAPRDFGKGMVSEGMLLAAENQGLKIVTVDGDMPPGSAVR